MTFKPDPKPYRRLRAPANRQHAIWNRPKQWLNLVHRGTRNQQTIPDFRSVSSKAYKRLRNELCPRGTRDNRQRSRRSACTILARSLRNRITAGESLARSSTLLTTELRPIASNIRKFIVKTGLGRRVDHLMTLKGFWGRTGLNFDIERTKPMALEYLAAKPTVYLCFQINASDLRLEVATSKACDLGSDLANHDQTLRTSGSSRLMNSRALIVPVR